MTVKLIGSSSGSVALDAPASTTGGANIEFKLPVADGSNGQVIKTDGSGNLSFTNSISETSGNFTVGYSDHVSGGVSPTTNSAYYNKIGKMVYVSLETGPINLTNLNSSYIFLVTNAFNGETVDSNWRTVGSAYYYNIAVSNNATHANNLVPTKWNGTSLYFVIPRYGTTSDNLTVNMMSTNSSRFFINYFFKVA